MTMHQTIHPLPAKATRAQFMVEDDKAMLRAARDLTKGLGEAKPTIYWTDMLVSAGVGYAGIAVAIVSGSLGVKRLAWVIGRGATGSSVMITCAPRSVIWKSVLAKPFGRRTQPCEAG